MSASTEKKNRIAAREAGTDKKALAAQEEAKKKAKSKRRWTWGTIGVLVLIAAILLLNSGLMYTATTALTANGEKYTPARVNYYYGNSYHTMANNYGNYASMIGLDTSLGLSGLKDQDCPMMENGTWRDYFRDAAKDEIRQTKALLSYAAQNGISLDEEEIAGVDAQFEGLGETAKAYGYGSADKLYAMNYGGGVTTKIVRQAAMDAELASKALNAYRDSLTWTEEELEAHYESLSDSRDLFTFETYYVTAETIENTVTDENGEETTEKTADAQTRAEAKATADAIVAAFKDGDDIEDLSERFAAAVDSQTGEKGEQPTERSGVSGSGLTASYAEWMKDARKAGDITVVPDAEEDPAGYNVVMFLSRDDNHYRTANVRHILVMAEADENGSYSDEAKAAAKAKAEEILNEYLAGEKTEESFAELAETYSDDGGSSANGGLYENVARGQMVAEFEDFCFAGHKPGDTGIVYGESGSYAGYHVMYYVGEGELYSNYLAKTDLQNEAMESWTAELTDACTITEGFGFRFVGK